MAVMLVKLTGCGSSDENPAAPGGNPPIAPPDADAGGNPPPGGPLTIAPGPSRGSAIAVSSDDSIVVAVNRDSGSVSVFKTTFGADNATASLAKTAEVKVGAEPWQVAIAPDGKSAYVVLRKDQKLVKIGALDTVPAVAGEVVVGAEPTGVALTPGGSRAWVANWVDGTVVGVDTASMAVTKTIDLNDALVKTGLLGDVKARPSLAHPRSIAITNNGDTVEDDESIYVTEYYAQRTAAEAPDGSNADTAKSGLVYKVKLADSSVSAIKLAPLTDMGFKDGAGGVAGCYPNQLQSITIQGTHAYVSSICASPKGPVGGSLANIQTTTAGLVSVIDLASDSEVTAATASLHKRFDDVFVKASTPDASKRYPVAPADVAFVAGGNVGYVAANGGDAVFRVRYDFTAADPIVESGAANNPFINLNPPTLPADKSGQNPIGIATVNQDAHKRFAFVANDITRNVSVLDFNTQSLHGGLDANAVVARSADMPAPNSTEDRIRKGRRFFNTATGRWSNAGQGWNGCQSCHTDGLTDNVTWYFARGPRQTTSLDGTYNKKDPTDIRILNWTAINDEVSDFEGNTRGISGGVGAVVTTNSTPPANTDRLTDPNHAGLAGSSDQLADPSNPLGLSSPSVRDDWQTITEYVKTIRSPRHPSNLDGAKVAAGRALFVNDGSCAGCHGGDKWTISKRFYTPGTDATNNLLTKAWAPPAGFPAALLPGADQKFMRFRGTDATKFGAIDQIQCILRPVGTFAKADAVVGAMPELRQDMVTPGQGNQANGNGFNPPSLLGMQTGAPYLHGGGATTLESLFSPTFQAHYGTLAPNFLSETDPVARAAKVDQLVQFLLSIDADADTTTIPTPGAQGGDFCSP
jgi:DNA-binding beta-propeller fold protein YncE